MQGSSDRNRIVDKNYIVVIEWYIASDYSKGGIVVWIYFCEENLEIGHILSVRRYKLIR